jgi:DNA-binding NtrC family response regulator
MKKQAIAEFERQWISEALQRCGGNVSAAARILQMKRQFLQQKMQSLGIQATDYRRTDGIIRSD